MSREGERVRGWVGVLERVRGGGLVERVDEKGEVVDRVCKQAGGRIDIMKQCQWGSGTVT